MFDLIGKTALVTGSAKRLGRAIALKLARCGMNIVAHYNTSQDESERLKKEVENLKAQAWRVEADLSKPEHAKELIDRSIELAGNIDLLINSASVFEQSSIMNFTEEAFQTEMQINALAPLALIRAFAKRTRTG